LNLLELEGSAKIVMFLNASVKRANAGGMFVAEIYLVNSDPSR
jgi:hypothetical protein